MREKRSSFNNYIVSWEYFEFVNIGNKEKSFEDLCRLLFLCEFVGGVKALHYCENNPGIETDPIEVCVDGRNLRIGFQAKVVHIVASINDEKIYLITAYIPDSDKWESDWKTRKEQL
ncbi:MAG: hypothetical protein J6H31_06635 [Butyrivibrio sp.]|nr:hypothetical protein [Butyrivibrio sp.]